jgi:ornithine cyclodeaminase/alanine dehydrogenase-like protein (mu-crystallin family)
MQWFDTAATREGLSFERLLPALQAMFMAGCTVPARHVHELPGPDGTRLTSLIMPAWLEGRCYGVKTVNIAPGNAARGLPGLHASYCLYDATTGEPLAMMDGNEITQRRTAAASALAASWLARPDARHLLVVGAGQVARCLPQAYRTVLPIRRVTVWARASVQAQALVDEFRVQGFESQVAPDLGAAVRAADVVSCATLASTPLVQGDWLQPGSHLDLIGSFTPTMREADDACFVGATLYVDTEEALLKSGDLLGPLARGVIQADEVRSRTLAALAQGTLAGRSSPAQRTVFKSVGTALEDLAAAMLVLDRGQVAVPPQPRSTTGP